MFDEIQHLVKNVTVNGTTELNTTLKTIPHKHKVKYDIVYAHPMANSSEI